MAGAGVYGCGGGHAGSRNRRQYGDFQPGGRGDSEAAAVSRSGAPDRRLGHLHAAIREAGDFARGDPSLAAADRPLRGKRLVPLRAARSHARRAGSRGHGGTCRDRVSAPCAPARRCAVPRTRLRGREPPNSVLLSQQVWRTNFRATPDRWRNRPPQRPGIHRRGRDAARRRFSPIGRMCGCRLPR